MRTVVSRSFYILRLGHVIIEMMTVPQVVRKTWPNAAMASGRSSCTRSPRMACRKPSSPCPMRALPDCPGRNCQVSWLRPRLRGGVSFRVADDLRSNGARHGSEANSLETDSSRGGRLAGALDERNCNFLQTDPSGTRSFSGFAASA
jgi:hypothetical protein